MDQTPTKAPRSSFGGVVLAGLATAGLTAVAASQTWLRARVSGMGPGSDVDVAGSDAAPLALALALVALAGWGVILVSQVRARRFAAGIGLLATTGVLIVVVLFWPDSNEVAARVVADRTVDEVVSVARRPWYWVTAVGALAQAAVLLKALRDAPTWPSMSSRYDAPAAGAPRSGPAAVGDSAPVADLELWKALDEGQDPTAR